MDGTDMKYLRILQKTYKHNTNNNEKLRPDRLGLDHLGPDWFGAGLIWGQSDSKSEFSLLQHFKPVFVSI